MTLTDEILSEVDPQGWDTPNKFDTILLRAHSGEGWSRKVDNKLRLSWSLLKSGLTCIRSATWSVYPEKFGINPEDLLFTDSLPSIRGSITQTLVEHIYLHSYLKLNPEEFIQALQASWRWGLLQHKPESILKPKQIIKVRNEIFAVLPTILETMNRETFWANSMSLEKPLWWDMPSMGGVRLTGKADLVLQDSDKYWLIDGKYCSKPECQDARQLTFYALILSKMTGKVPQRALFWFYPQGEVRDYSKDTLTPIAMQSILDDAFRVATKIKLYEDDTTPSTYNCKWCPHRTHCSDCA